MAVRPRHPVELRDLALDLTQLCFDLAGFVDPTPVSDGVSALIALGRGQWLDAAISGVAMVPYVGDLAKAGKLGKYAQSLENAITLAKNSPEAARLLAPVFARLDQALRLLPDAPSLQPIRSAVARFLQSHHAARAASLLPDIRRHFTFRRFQRATTNMSRVSAVSVPPARSRPSAPLPPNGPPPAAPATTPDPSSAPASAHPPMAPTSASRTPTSIPVLLAPSNTGPAPAAPTSISKTPGNASSSPASASRPGSRTCTASEKPAPSAAKSSGPKSTPTAPGSPSRSTSSTPRHPNPAPPPDNSPTHP